MILVPTIVRLRKLWASMEPFGAGGFLDGAVVSVFAILVHGITAVWVIFLLNLVGAEIEYTVVSVGAAMLLSATFYGMLRTARW